MGIIAQVLSPWTVDAEGANVPTLFIDHMVADRSMMDVTGQPTTNLVPAPNMMVVEVWEPLSIADIVGDSTYYVLWSEVVEDDIT